MNIEVNSVAHRGPPTGHTTGPLTGRWVSSAGIIPNSQTDAPRSTPILWINTQAATLATISPIVNRGVSSVGFSSR